MFATIREHSVLGITDAVPSQLPTVGQVSPGEVPCLELGLFTRVEWNFLGGTSGKKKTHPCLISLTLAET